MKTICGICEAETDRRRFCSEECARIGNLIRNKKAKQELKALSLVNPEPETKIVMPTDTPRLKQLELVRKLNRRRVRRVYVEARG